MIRTYPESEYADRARFERLRLDLEQLPDAEAIRRLQRVESGQACFDEALLELARRQFLKSLRELEMGSRLSEPDLDSLSDSVAQLVNCAQASSEQKALGRLWLVNALLRQNQPDLSRVESELRNIEVDLKDLPSSLTLQKFMTEFSFYRFKWAELKGDSASAERYAKVLIEAGAEPSYELSGLVFLAKRLPAEDPSTESGMEASPAIMEAAEFEQTEKIFRRIIELTASTDEQLRDSLNGQFAVAQLAWRWLKTGRYEQAEASFQRLIKLFPNQPSYWLGLARTQMRRQDFVAAESSWRRLNQIAPAGSSMWFEAKYHQVVALRETEHPDADVLYRQTMLLNPEMPSPWKKRFEELGKR